MKLRVVKKPDGTFEPQYWEEEGRWQGWHECHLDNYLVARIYHSLEDAQSVCLRYAEKIKKEKGEVVWEDTV